MSAAGFQADGEVRRCANAAGDGGAPEVVAGGAGPAREGAPGGGNAALSAAAFLGQPAATAPSPASGAGHAPHLSPRFRLQWEAAQQAWVLLYPEGMVRLNHSAAEILRRCDGSRDAAALTAELEAAFDTCDLQAEVAAFLAHARERGWVQGG
ncbi:pyrroloquinoline quinone biosynthesis peptide chaperone PqqD [Azoarcus indigens]|uniref:Coenzyme PQQ biosynthesis protein PqqD n=1 Tax=Azoarcus indigens TaxID=29545 RepID=A0A4R6DZ75_9RHOO|nr:coenzyme PQQ biosynthesis protein PqqD [Azoarcus indigens]